MTDAFGNAALLVGDLAKAILRTLEDKTAAMDQFTAYLADMERQWEANSAGDDSVLPVLAEVKSIRLYWTNLVAALAATPEDQS